MLVLCSVNRPPLVGVMFTCLKDFPGDTMGCVLKLKTDPPGPVGVVGRPGEAGRKVIKKRMVVVPFLLEKCCRLVLNGPGSGHHIISILVLRRAITSYLPAGAMMKPGDGGMKTGLTAIM